MLASVVAFPAAAHYATHSAAAARPCLGIHRGALDQTLVTSEPPPRVMERVRQVLDNMGVLVQVESEFKYRCICAKQRKSPGSSTLGIDQVQQYTAGSPGDAIDEVRFSVELTRLDGLHETFSLDVRRLKGNLRSYKSLYETIRQRASEWL